MTDTQEYSRGYQAGRKKGDKDLNKLQNELNRSQDELRLLRAKVDNQRKERVYMQSLELALKHCEGWRIGKKPIDDVEGYCKLAKVFADNAITCIDS